MAKRPKDRTWRSLDEVLQSTVDTLFPHKMGKHQVKVNSRDSCGDTPLHVIVRRGDLHGVRLLIEAGADVNAIGDMGETPLHVAVGQGSPDVVEALLRAGARDDIRSEFDDTPREKMEQFHPELKRLLDPKWQDW
ncbi:ankyrin repeat domain-containing protein [Pontivivens ytuae]|uniref:Ankyrin repeat domain-containing protein n=1 Tax=Pontivivens ytuae TaxID=2789856 RepID=A0A7S9LTD7_9RHOB|nr:ankyrin repeat domain-containing protein [Pontivivens ytuae]QPH54853.1 ankyrin repeat domain-containing protein [Pontivivens ytuae]